MQRILPMHEVEEIQVLSLGGEDPLEKEMATCSSILAWEIPRTVEPGGLQSMGHDWAHCLVVPGLIGVLGIFTAAYQLLVVACGVQFPYQGSNPGPLHWELRVLAIGPLGSPSELDY